MNNSADIEYTFLSRFLSSPLFTYFLFLFRELKKKKKKPPSSSKSQASFTHDLLNSVNLSNLLIESSA